MEIAEVRHLYGIKANFATSLFIIQVIVVIATVHTDDDLLVLLTPCFYFSNISLMYNTIIIEDRSM
jgi:hypothetical protein